MYKTIGAKASKRAKTADRIRKHATAITVFNAGEEPAVLVHEGMYYTFPPNALWMGPSDEAPRQYDGMFQLEDKYGVDPDVYREARKKAKASKGAFDFKSLPQDHRIATAVDLAEHAEAKLGARGVVVLSGDPAIDEPLKRDAKNAWVKYRRERATKTMARYQRRSAEFYADPRRFASGENPPVMDPYEVAEKAWLDELEDGQIDGRKHTCPARCGFQHDDASVMTRHVRINHPAAVQRADAPAVEVPPVEAAKNRGGRPRKSAEAPAA